MNIEALAILALIGFVLVFGIVAMHWRVVVPTNSVHIVQSGKLTTSYGRGLPAGNTYYAFPAWLPIIGRRIIVLPTSVFDINLDSYAAYDVGRVPFQIDIMAFFRVTDSNLAAERVASIADLHTQLQGILQGVCRSILASSEIEEILQGRAKFGQLFTAEVDENLKQWGIQSVKQIELMDIRDQQNSKVIANIMAKKQSLIEKESRVAVAGNQQAAQTAEIEASQTVAVRKAQADQAVGERNAQKDAQVGIAQQVAAQQVNEAAATTAEKQMAVQRVQTVRAAEIKRDAEVVAADQNRQVAVIAADANKQQTILVADGNLEQARRHAVGVTVEGTAKGAAETAVLMAPVNSQIALAKEIGANAAYQTYLVSVRTIEKDQAVGIAQAEALTKADVKVIANTGAVVDGVKNVMDLFTSKGGTQLGAMVEALKQTPAGAAIVERIAGNGSGPTTLGALK